MESHEKEMVDAKTLLAKYLYVYDIVETIKDADIAGFNGELEDKLRKKSMK